jgi:hypothetical protein
LISIKNASDYANLPILVTIPVNIPEDSFAMVFYYNEKEGILDGLPLLGQNSTSITVTTRHFSNLVVISTNKKELMALSPESGFTPGVDTWQIKSIRTRISSGGTCSGNTFSALWYYLERKVKHGDHSLFGLYNSTNAHEDTPFWEDDSNAIVLTAVVQNDIHNYRIGYFISSPTLSDSDIYFAFASALENTQQPQVLSMWSADGTIGHAVIVYRADKGKLYIADPNDPSNTDLAIELKNGKFSPYGRYCEFRYYGITSLESWKLLAQRWECFSSVQYSGACFDKLYPEWGGGMLSYTGSCGGGNGFLCYLKNRQKCVVTTEYNSVYKISVCPEIPGLKNEFFFKGEPVLPENIHFDRGENIIGIYSYTENNNKQSWDYGRTWYGFDYLTVMYEPIQLDPACYQGSFTYPSYWTEPFCYYMIVTPQGFSWSHN